MADTAFHQTLSPPARTYAIPKDLAARHGIRRFGFHGIGHSYMMERYAEISGRAALELDLITLQLGAGCSITAISKGRSVDTSMGLTPLEGLMMATRSGDIDPAITSFLAAREGLSPADVERILNTKSGLLGVSGISLDMREVQAAAARGDENATLAIEVFCYRALKYIGAYLAVLGRADAILFGGGIGEHSDLVRERICTGLAGFGVMLDRERNRDGNGREYRLSASESKIAIWTIPLDEELHMARATAALLKGGGHRLG
jgi:acetate kinase